MRQGSKLFATCCVVVAALASSIGVALGDVSRADARLTKVTSIHVFTKGDCEVITYSTDANGDDTFSSETVPCGKPHNNEKFAELRVRPKYQGTLDADNSSHVATAACEALFRDFVGVALHAQKKYDIGTVYNTHEPREIRRFTCEIVPPDDEPSAMFTGSARHSRPS